MFQKVVLFSVLLLGFTFSRIYTLYAQTPGSQQGVVFYKGTNTRIGKANVRNLNNNAVVITNELGIFNIKASIGDTLQITDAAYAPVNFLVTDLKDAIIYLQPFTQLREVVITEKSLKSELEEMRQTYRKDGVFYKGKPPLLTALTNPISFLGERFGKSGAKARRFEEFASQELGFQEVNKRYNANSVKAAVPIKDDEIDDFLFNYRPSIDQIRQWNDYDLLMYIKRSYDSFIDIKKNFGDTKPKNPFLNP